jgi:hypothetical protein
MFDMIISTNDSQPRPKVHARREVGNGWKSSNGTGKDFQCYDIFWVPSRDEEGIPYDMKLQFGLGLHLYRKAVCPRSVKKIPALLT